MDSRLRTRLTAVAVVGLIFGFVAVMAIRLSAERSQEPSGRPLVTIELADLMANPEAWVGKTVRVAADEISFSPREDIWKGVLRSGTYELQVQGRELNVEWVGDRPAVTGTLVYEPTFGYLLDTSR